MSFLGLLEHYLPLSLRLIPMDAQWMLKGCSMDAYCSLLPLSPLYFSSISLKKFIFLANVPKFFAKIMLFCQISKFLLIKMKFSCIFQFFVVILQRKIGIMNRKIILIAALSVTMTLAAQKQNPRYLTYIEQWKSTAVENQKDYGIPASIIMAQALLESAAGQSELAEHANNHFGIKCTSEWYGGVYYYDDDSKGECFRQYGDAAQSFKDHALFLQRPRYATCFEIAVEDYEGWAHRLKACGYATDPGYAPKLIKIIEEYRLDTLASVKPKRPLKAEVVRRSEPIMVIHNDPEPEYVTPLTAQQERDSFYISHPKKKCNGVAYVLAREGDTYANVAFRLDLRERELREFNDALGRDLKVGDRIYLFYKHKTGDKDFVWSNVGQSLWRLSQEEGVSLEAIQKINELDPSIRVFRTKQKIWLRKVKDGNR